FSQMSAGRECGSGWEFQPCRAASSSRDPCVVSCGASRVIIFPPPVLLTFPGPILSTCPQQTLLGSPGMPEGAAGASRRPPREETPRSGG
ncbi:KRFB protein, partial [Atrichornis clamosus]|nr:KRFB protein [Atrichornis clamosus]